MLSYCNNDFLSRETTINTECQMLFYQKMRELLYMHSGISYSFKIHNSYSILQELLDTIEDYEKSKIIGMIVEEIRREAERYHVNIDTALKGFVSELNQEDYGKVIGAIVNVCNFENESNEYRFLALWSSLEALFRSTQYEKVIGAIKNIIPDIITRRYIYYRLLDFIRDAYKAGVSYNYRGRDFVKKMPGDADVEALFMLLREDEKFYQLADICKRKYVLLYHKCKDIKNMTINSGAIKNTIAHHKEILEFHLQRMYRVRNKFVHHAEIDKNIDALYKHLLVYSWECIREMAYVSKTRGIKSLEELYSYFRMNYKVAMKYLRDTENQISFINIKEGYII